MTDTELREIDAQVHREVMGTVWDEARCRGCGWPIVPEGEQGCWPSNCSMRPYPDQRADEPPHYSSSIAAAWQVVEKLVADGRVFIVKGDGLRTGDFAKKWTTLCGNQMRTDATSAPLAICLAALKAVRGDMGQSGA